MKKVITLLSLVCATSVYAQVSVSYTGGLELSGGAILNSNFEPYNGTSVGIFVAGNGFDPSSFSSNLNSFTFNSAIDQEFVNILHYTQTGLTELGDDSLVLPEGTFVGGTNQASLGLGQVYIFAFDTLYSGEGDWSFNYGGIWTDPTWIIGSDSSQFELNIDLSTASVAIFGDIFPTDLNRVDAILAPAIPEPSTYALMMMGVALGFAVYRRRKQKR